MSGPILERTTFRTSRLLDFASEKELTMQTGHSKREWPLVIVKELIDNALDACEELGIAPQITVTVDERGIEVADGGEGIPPELVDLLLDFSIRASSREAYVAPDRGAQGNALKTIIAMPFVIDGERGRVDITGRGVRSEIEFGVDRIAQRPVADVRRSLERGSSVRVYLPNLGTSSGDESRRPFLQNVVYADGTRSDPTEDDRFIRLAEDFTFLNPHLTLTLDWFGETKRIEATNPGWSKWRPSSPTSPHWYEPEHLERLLGAYITHDRQNGNRRRTVREFVSEFRGLTSTIKQKAVLEETGLARASLAELLSEDERDFDHEQVETLLRAMKAQAKPVIPKHLGTIGRAHLKARFDSLGVRPGSFEYVRKGHLGDDGLPQVTEIAFAALEDERANRRLITGVNWSAAWVNPFRQLGASGEALEAILAERRFQWWQPIALLVHVAHPRVQYADRGKSTVVAR